MNASKRLEIACRTKTVIGRGVLQRFVEQPKNLAFLLAHLFSTTPFWLTAGSCLRWGVNRQRRYPPLKS
ncbi:MAG: hypothetical protein H6537_10535 [Bacteroidales bacterium]|nr:hypothetical protein [Bacteroidales bacterium]